MCARASAPAIRSGRSTERSWATIPTSRESWPPCASSVQTVPAAGCCSARAVAVAAAAAKADLHVLSRDAARARDFAAWARGQGTRAEPARGKLEPDIAINATPAGLKDADPLPLDPDSAAHLHAALDLVYAPGGTRWVRTLTAAGVRAQDGREVLVHQGAAAFSRFFPDEAAPLEVMRAAVSRALGA